MDGLRHGSASDVLCVAWGCSLVRLTNQQQVEVNCPCASCDVHVVCSITCSYTDSQCRGSIACLATHSPCPPLTPPFPPPLHSRSRPLLDLLLPPEPLLRRLRTLRGESGTELPPREMRRAAGPGGRPWRLPLALSTLLPPRSPGRASQRSSRIPVEAVQAAHTCRLSAHNSDPALRLCPVC
jgi:hypothetical protein